MVDSPKKRLLRGKAISERIFNLLNSSEFQSGADAAMLQVIEELGDVSEPDQAAAAYNRIMGARTFLRKLQTIADRPKPPSKRATKDNLEQNK